MQIITHQGAGTAAEVFTIIHLEIIAVTIRLHQAGAAHQAEAQPLALQEVQAALAAEGLQEVLAVAVALVAADAEEVNISVPCYLKEATWDFF